MGSDYSRRIQYYKGLKVDGIPKITVGTAISTPFIDLKTLIKVSKNSYQTTVPTKLVGMLGVSAVPTKFVGMLTMS